MHLSDHDLHQLDEAYLDTLAPKQARALLGKAPADLKAARTRLGQNPSNSSRPPRSRAPWETADGRPDGEHAADASLEVRCPRGHWTRAQPGSAEAQADWSVALTQWHLARLEPVPQ